MTVKNFSIEQGLDLNGLILTNSSGELLLDGNVVATESFVTGQGYITSSDLSGLASETYVNTAVNDLVSGAPGLLDTLNEIAAAINDDANYATTVTTALATKAPLANPTFTGTVVLPSATSIGDVSATELGYLNGVTSSVQTQLDAKALATNPTFTVSASSNVFGNSSPISYAGASLVPVSYLYTGQKGFMIQQAAWANLSPFSGYTFSNLAAGDSIVIANATGGWGSVNNGTFTVTSIDANYNSNSGYYIIYTSQTPAEEVVQSGTVNFVRSSSSTISSTEISYLDGVTSLIQTQLDSKIAKSLVDAKGDLLVGSANDTVARLAVGTNGYLLTADSTQTNGVKWAAAPAVYSAPTIGTSLISSGSTVTSISGLTIGRTSQSNITTTSPTIVSSFDTNNILAAKFNMALKNAYGVMRTSEVLIHTDGTSVDFTEYAIMEMNGSLPGLEITAEYVSGGTVNLLVKVSNANTVNVLVRIVKTTL